MKTDRELLELAAKAAGIEYAEYGELIGGAPCLYSKHANLGIWAPLTDDGDALRLAVNLTFEVDVCRSGIAVRTPNGIKVLVDSTETPCPYAATRRAIVRAAAAIGESA